MFLQNFYQAAGVIVLTEKKTLAKTTQSIATARTVVNAKMDELKLFNTRGVARNLIWGWGINVN